MLMTLFRISASVGILIFLLLLFSRIINHRYQARVKYWLWLILALRLMLPVTITLPEQTASLPVMQLAVSGTIQQETAVEITPAPASGTAAIKTAQPVSSPAEAGSNTETSPQNAASFTALLRTLDSNVLLTAIWALGALVFLLHSLASSYLLHHRVRRWAKPAACPEAQQLLSTLRTELHIRQPIRLLYLPEVGSPLVLGWIKPSVVLPEEEWEPLELYYVLRHELTHVKRRDALYKLVLLCANAVHWFNPLVYLMRLRACKDLEISCDALVMAEADQAAKRLYCESIMAAVKRTKKNGTGLHAALGNSKKAVMERFREIFSKAKRRSGAALMTLVVLVSILCGCMIEENTTSLQPENREAEETVLESASEISDIPEESSLPYDKHLPLTVEYASSYSRGNASLVTDEIYGLTISLPGEFSGDLTINESDGVVFYLYDCRAQEEGYTGAVWGIAARPLPEESQGGRIGSTVWSVAEDPFTLGHDGRYIYEVIFPEEPDSFDLGHETGAMLYNRTYLRYLYGYKMLTDFIARNELEEAPYWETNFLQQTRERSKFSGEFYEVEFCLGQMECEDPALTEAARYIPNLACYHMDAATPAENLTVEDYVVYRLLNATYEVASDGSLPMALNAFLGYDGSGFDDADQAGYGDDYRMLAMAFAEICAREDPMEFCSAQEIVVTQREEFDWSISFLYETGDANIRVRLDKEESSALSTALTDVELTLTTAEDMETPVTSFTANQQLHYVLQAGYETSGEDKTVAATYMIRDSENNPVYTYNSTKQWSGAWSTVNFSGTLPDMPQTPGTYTFQVYFDDQLIAEAAFSVAAAS